MIDSDSLIKFKKWIPFVFILFSVVIRFFSFFPSIIGHDESTYTVMAMEMLKGKLLYVDTLDIKPVGIFLIFSLIIYISKSIFFIRLVAAIFIGLSAYQLYLIKSKFTRNEHLKIIVGFTYIIIFSLSPILRPSYFGLPVNTELFFSFFTLASINLLLNSEFKVKKSFIAGLVLGLGILFKYIIIIEVLGIYVFFFIVLILDKRNFKEGVSKLITSGLVYLIGFLVPMASVHLYYYIIESYDAIFYITFIAPKKYGGNFDWIKQLDFIAGMHQLLITMILFYLAVLFKYKDNVENKREKLFIACWFVFTCIAMVSTGNAYNHYKLQLVSVMAFAIPNIIFNIKWITGKVKESLRLKLAYSYILANLIFYSFMYYNKYYSADQPVNAMASHINKKKSKDDLLFNRVHKYQIIHFLTGLNSPSRIVHLNNLKTPKRLNVLGVNREEECEMIRQQKPKFIVGDDNLCFSSLELKEHGYMLDTIIQGVNLFVVDD